MSWARIVSLPNTHWRAILVEERDRQLIRVALWAPDDRVRWVASLLWDRGLHAGDRSTAIAYARRVARDAMRVASCNSLDDLPRIDFGLDWVKARDATSPASRPGR